jgi:hypothetical protein
VSWTEEILGCGQMPNFITLFVTYVKSQHKRMEKTTLQEASYFVLFKDYYEVKRGKTCSTFRRDKNVYKIQKEELSVTTL